MEDFDMKLAGAAIDLLEALQNRLKPGGRGYHHGDLSRSIQVLVVPGKGLTIQMEDYGGYIENGTPNPTTAEEIMDWVQDKIMPKVKKKSAKVKKRIATNIAKHISLFGPRPFPFVRLTLAQDLPVILRNNGL